MKTSDTQLSTNHAWRTLTEIHLVPVVRGDRLAQDLLLFLVGRELTQVRLLAVGVGYSTTRKAASTQSRVARSAVCNVGRGGGIALRPISVTQR